MGWVQNIIKKLNKKAKYADMLSGYSPVFSQFGQDIYASDVVQQAIGCIVKEMKKLRLMHIKGEGQDVVPVKGNIQKILDNPNELMTTSDFLEKVFWQLFLNYNAFIVPTYKTWNEKGEEKRVYTGLYPVAPTNVDFVQDDTGEMYVKFLFRNGYETTLLYRDVIHLRYNYSVNDYMGGNESGQPDNGALLKTLQINDDLLNGVAAAMKSSFTINGVVKYNTVMDKGKTEKAIEELEEHIKKNESGFLPLDLRGEYIPIKKDIKLVDAETLKFLDEKILRQYGVSLPILTGDYTKAQYEAFYQKTLENLIVSLSQGFTKVMLTDGQKNRGNQIKAFPKELIFLTVEQTIEVVKLLGDAGRIYDNEARVAFGLMPSEELKGRRMMSLNYIDAEYATAYQMRKGAKSDEKE